MRDYRIGIGILLLLCGLIAFAQAPANRAKELVQKVAPSIVTVRAVVKYEVKYEGQSETDESKFAQRGSIITPDGVVMVSATLLSSESFKRMLGLEDEDKVEVSLTPQSFKVVIEQESKEYEAELIATDSVLGLAFLKVKDLGGRTLQPVQFKEAPLDIGSELFCVTRMPKGYDLVPYLMRLEVVAELAKPRRAAILNYSTDEVGLPVFSADGSAIGVIVYVRPVASDDGEEDLGFNLGASEAVLPTSTLLPLLEQVKKRAQEAK